MKRLACAATINRNTSTLCPRAGVFRIKLASVICALAIPFATQGAQVEWGNVYLYNWSESNSAELLFETYWNFAIASIEAEQEGDYIKLTHYGLVEMEYWVNTRATEKGSIVDETSIPRLAVSTDDEFWENWEHSDDSSEWEIYLPAGGSSIFYLSFAGQNHNSPEMFYGWVELEFHEWEFNLLDSVVTVGGGPLVVGQLPVPEPASLVLAILGIAVLSTSVLVTGWKVEG